MTDNVKILYEKARALTPKEREELVEMLLVLEEDSVAAEIDRALADECDRRWQEHVASGEPTVDAFQAIEDARRALKSGR